MTINRHEAVERNARYARHIRELGAAFHIIIREDLDTKHAHDAGAGFTRQTHQKIISIAPVIDETTYAVALHELGHLCSAVGTCRQSQGSLEMRKTSALEPQTVGDVRLMLEEEMAAWEWAKHYAMEWTPAMTQLALYTLNQYRLIARRCGAL